MKDFKSSVKVKDIRTERPALFWVRSLFLILLLILASFFSPAQDVLENGSFEDYKYCPANFNQSSLNTIHNWRQVSKGTPDYFHSCSHRVGVPDNMFGKQPAREGEAYVGMAIFSASKTDYREYLQAKLKRPLSAGEMVCFEMFVSPADYDLFVCDGFGVYFSEERPSTRQSGVIDAKPQFNNPQLHMLDERDQWTMISDVFVAAGGEEYITIGNFRKDREMKVLRRNPAQGAKTENDWAYLYFDDMRLEIVDKREDCSCVNDIIRANVTDPPVELSEVREIDFQAVLFDFDESTLTENSKLELNNVVKAMLRRTSLYMEIIGHTDIIGGDNYNVELSEDRAHVVIEYLVSKGIDRSRLKMRYYGSQMPIADNTSIEGRAQNRRVEFQILEKKFELYEQ